MSSSGDGDDDPPDGASGPAVGVDGDADDGDGESDAWWQTPDPEPPSVGPDVPEVDVPEVEIPGSGDAADVGDVDVDTAKGFWRLVLIFDVALLALALGPMFVYFEGDVRRGGMLLAFGAVVFLYGAARYREFRAEDGAETDALEEA